MIYRVRFEGGADNADELEREFHLLAHHLGLVGFFEGVLGRESFGPESVIESRPFSETTMLNGRPFSFRYAGRHTVGFVPAEYEYEKLHPMPQPDYRVFAFANEPVPIHVSGSLAPSVSVSVSSAGLVLPESAVEQRDVIVLQRHRPLSPAPTDELATDELLDRLRGLPNVEEVEIGYDKTQRDGSGWRVNVVFKKRPDEEQMALSSPGETLREAVEKALEFAVDEPESFVMSGKLANGVMIQARPDYSLR